MVGMSEDVTTRADAGSAGTCASAGAGLSAGLSAAAAAASVWVRWSYSARDGQVHAFPLDDSQRGRWPQALCSHVVPPGALGLNTTGPRCSWCVLGTSASGTGRRRRRRIDPPGLGVRLLARFRRHRGPGAQRSLPSELSSELSSEFPVVALPLVPAQPAERAGRVPGSAEPGSVPSDVLVPPGPEHGSAPR